MESQAEENENADFKGIFHSQRVAIIKPILAFQLIFYVSFLEWFGLHVNFFSVFLTHKMYIYIENGPLINVYFKKIQQAFDEM